MPDDTAGRRRGRDPSEPVVSELAPRDREAGP
mgnify:FL=1